jgi:DNA-binding transcriptional ArsR family regulator
MSPDQPSRAAALAPVFAALADPTRLELIDRLGCGEHRSIAQLAEGLHLSHQGVTKHLRVLEKAGVVQAHRHGRERRYRCAPAALREALGYLDRVSRQWDEALERLKDLVETTPGTRPRQ